MKIEQPLANEYANFYQGYVGQVGDDDVLDFLINQYEAFVKYLREIPDERMGHRYHKDKWSIAEVIGHITDVERVMAYRILRISRHDKTPMAGFDQDDYIASANFGNRGKDSLIKEFESLRIANLEMVLNLSQEQTIYTGETNGSIFSVRALVYILAGHVAHHWAILRSRYGIE